MELLALRQVCHSLRLGHRRYGDNDTLSAQVAALVHSEYLFLMTDVDGLYTSNPNRDPNVSDMATSVSERVSVSTSDSCSVRLVSAPHNVTAITSGRHNSY